jgi:hypothetical protein
MITAPSAIASTPAHATAFRLKELLRISIPPPAILGYEL